MVGTVVLVEKLYDNTPTRVSILVKGLYRGLVRERLMLEGNTGLFECARVEQFEDNQQLNGPDLAQLTDKMLRLIDKFNQRYETNSLWKVITQKAGQVPKNDPILLSFWALSCLPPSVRIDTRARLLRLTSTTERLRFVTSSHMFKNCQCHFFFFPFFFFSSFFLSTLFINTCSLFIFSKS